MKILCIDDEPLALRLLVSMLQERSDVTEICSFDNSADALAAAENTEFDIALVDIMLGNDSGLDFAESLRTMQPGCKIIYCTGYSQYAVESINRGIVDGYLLKPIEDQKLQEIIDKYRKKKVLTVKSSGMHLQVFDSHGQTVTFNRSKTMLLFSILLNRGGKEKLLTNCAKNCGSKIQV